MANELWVNHDLAKGLVDPHQLAGLTYTGSNAGDTFGVHILRNGVPSTELAGRTVTGYLIRPDQQTVVIAGAISGSDVTVTLPSEAYAYSGRCSLVIRVSDTNGVKIPVFAAYFNIGVTSTDETIDPGELIPSLEDLLAQIDAMEAATNTAQLLIASYEDRMSVAVVKSVNLYNLVSRNPGIQLYSDGSEHSNANYVTTNYIQVTPGVRYYAGYWVDGNPGAWGTSGQVIGIGAFYNANQELISPTVATDVMRTEGAVAPSGAAFFRLSINCGTVTNAYELVVVAANEMPDEYVEYWTLSPGIVQIEQRTDEISEVLYTPVVPPNLYDGGDLTITDAVQSQSITFETPLANALKIEFDCLATDVTSIVVQVRKANSTLLKQESVDVATGVRSSVEFVKYDDGVGTIVLKLKTQHGFSYDVQYQRNTN